MPGVIGNIVLGLAVSTNKWSRGLKGAEGDVQRLGGQISALASTLSGLYLGAMAGQGVAGFFTHAAKASSDLNEQVSATGVMFGDASDVVLAGAQEMADKFGTVKSEFLSSANSLAPLIDGLGRTKAEGAALTVSVLRLADDLSSIRNVPVAEALAAIQSGLVGESEPLRRFGVLLSEAAVEQEAFRLGLAHSKGDLTDAAKLEARLSLITRGLAYAQGDHARTASSAANASREAWGRYQNTMAEFGKTLEPVTASVLNLANVAMKALNSEVEKNQGLLASVGNNLGSALKQATDDTTELGQAWSLTETAVSLASDSLELVYRGSKAFGTRTTMGVLDLGRAWGWVADQITGSNWVDHLTLTLEGMHRSENENVGEIGRFFGLIADDGNQATATMTNLATAVGGVGKQLKDASQQAADFGGATDSIVGDRDGGGKNTTRSAGIDLAHDWGIQSATVGMGSHSTAIEKLKQENWDGEDLGPLEGLAKMLDQFDEFKSRMDELASGAKQLVESVATPMEKLEAEKQRIGQMLSLGLIDQTTAARGMIRAEKASGLGQIKNAGAMEYGSKEARSTLLAAQNRVSGAGGAMQDSAKIQRDLLKVQAEQNMAIQRMQAMMRQFLGSTAPVMAKM